MLMKKTPATVVTFLLAILSAGYIGLHGVSGKIHDFPLYNVYGERTTSHSLLKKLRGDSFLVINFTSINCVPCRREIPPSTKTRRSKNSETPYGCASRKPSICITQ